MRKICLLFMVTIILFSFLHTEDLEEKTISLTIEKAVKIGLKNSKQLKIEKKDYNISKKDFFKSKTKFYPEINFNSTLLKTDQKEENSITIPRVNKKIMISPEMDSQIKNTVSLKQPIFTGFLLTNNMKIKKMSKDIKKLNLKKKKIKTIYDIKKIYATILKLQNYKNVLNKTKNQIKAHLNDVKNFYNEGMATKVDILKVKDKLSSIKLNIIENNNNILKQKNRLKNILAISLDKNIKLTSKLNYSIDIKSRKKYIKMAFDNKPILKQISLNKNISKLKSKLSNSSFYPKIYLTGNYHYDKPNSSIQPIEDKYQDSWEVGINISFNIFSGTSRFVDYQKNKLNEQKSELIYEDTKEKVKNKIINLYLDFNKENKKVDVVRDSLQEAKESYKISKDMFQEGLIKSSELLDAEIILLQKNTELLNTKLDLKLSELKLLKEAGVLGYEK